MAGHRAGEALRACVRRAALPGGPGARKLGYSRRLEASGFFYVHGSFPARAPKGRRRPPPITSRPSEGWQGLHVLPASPRPCFSQTGSYPDSGFRKVGPHGDFFASGHVRVAVSLESGLQLLQLLAGEVRALPPLLLLQRAVLGGAPRQRGRGLLRVCGSERGGSQGAGACADSRALGPQGVPQPRAGSPSGCHSRSHPHQGWTAFSSTTRRGRAHRCAPGPCTHVLEAEGVECQHPTVTGQGSEPPPHRAARTPWREGSEEKRRHISG